MRDSHRSTVRAAYKALALVITSSELDRIPVTHFEPTDLASLPELPDGRLDTARRETAQANRMRAASHMLLVAASDALAAALDLSELSMDLTSDERERLLASIGGRTGAAGRCAAQASEILTGDMEPPSDDAVVVSKLGF